MFKLRKFDLKNEEKYSPKEEIVNAITHGIGALLSLVAIVLLVVFSSIEGNVWKIVSTSIYGFSLFVLYLFSTLYHSITHKKVKNIFEIFDHASIFILIAGTYTPFTLVTLRGTIGWILFGIVWTLAILGIVFKVFFVKQLRITSTLLYILMGWLVVFAMKPLVSNLPEKGVYWLVIGGIFYTIGTIFYIWRKIPYHHAIWHVIVLLGSISHFFAVFFYV
ncbi:hemolysin III family protein [Thermosipho ferrireducens]|uniref:Hemolysin III family protein n=1 Tax=Thermosipho ferrireducens TaxID=2571116 RepID=A0ABX7S787_9BACT|nr:hemolysin III family protein [Thermosipho ferrireducens]QTA38452.1 hemolysin III family protein [Thermosipho ferrireducens]